MTFEFEYDGEARQFALNPSNDDEMWIEAKSTHTPRGWCLSGRIDKEITTGIRAIMSRVERDDTLWKELMAVARNNVEDWDKDPAELDALAKRWEAK